MLPLATAYRPACFRSTGRPWRHTRSPSPSKARTVQQAFGRARTPSMSMVSRSGLFTGAGLTSRALRTMRQPAADHSSSSAWNAALNAVSWPASTRARIDSNGDDILREPWSDGFEQAMRLRPDAWEKIVLNDFCYGRSDRRSMATCPGWPLPRRSCARYG